MTGHQQTMALGDEIDKLVERFRQEFDLTYAQVTGVLQMKIWLLNKEAVDTADEDDGDG